MFKEIKYKKNMLSMYLEIEKIQNIFFFNK